MELPKTTSEYMIWLGMQFPVLGAAILLAYWAVKYATRLYDRKSDETEKLNERLIAEKDKQIGKLEERIRHLESEVAELRAKLSRPKKPPGESNPLMEESRDYLIHDFILHIRNWADRRRRVSDSPASEASQGCQVCEMGAVHPTVARIDTSTSTAVTPG